ncbi:MAG: endonuclease/exonuclease/phosphatase family protein [Verrucomicrobiota bacterium]
MCPLSAKVGDTIRLATFNLDNYLISDRYLDGVWRPAYPKPESEKDGIRRTIVELKPDILFVQEIGSFQYLEELRADLALHGLHFTYAVHLEGPDQVRHIAVLSMLPPVDVVKHAHLSFKYLDRSEKVKRGMLEVSFELPDGVIFKAFGVHLKSRYTEDKADPKSHLRRTREAEVCRNKLIERTLDLGVEHYMAVGDFNEHPKGAALRRFSKRGSLNFGIHLPIADGRGHQWTYFYEKYTTYSQVDGFVLSEKLLKRVRGQSGTIADNLSGSDHRLVYLDLETE